MNIQEANERLSALEAEAKKLRVLINSTDNKSFKDRFWELFQDVNQIKVDKKKYPCSIFGFKDNIFIWEWDSKSSYFRMSSSNFFSKLEQEFNYDMEVRDLIKLLLKEHFNCEDITPFTIFPFRQVQLEEHFNCH